MDEGMKSIIKQLVKDQERMEEKQYLLRERLSRKDGRKKKNLSALGRPMNPKKDLKKWKLKRWYHRLPE